MNVTIKRSFGTAFKLFDYRNMTTSAIMTVAVIALFFLTPSYAEFISIVFDGDTYLTLVDGVAW